MDWKALAPGLAIGAVALYAVSRLAKGGGSTQPSVYNALVPTSAQTPANRDAARVSAFSSVANIGLAQIGAQSQKDQAASNLELAKASFANQLSALGSRIWNSEQLATINNQGLLDRLQLQLTDRNYDRQLQQRAIGQTFALAQSGQIGNQAGSILNSILAALGRSQQAQGRGSQGGSSGGASSPGGFPASRQPTAQERASAMQRAYALLAGIWNRNANAPLVDSYYPFLGYVQPQDTSGYGWLDGYGQQGFDYWQGYDTSSVSSSFQGTGIGGQGFDFAGFYGYPDVSSLLSDYGYSDLNSFLADYYY